MYMHLSRIQNPVRVDAHHYKGTIGAEGSSFRDSVEVKRTLEGFTITLSVKVNDAWIHRSEFTKEEREEWAKMDAKAWRESSDAIEAERLDAIRVVKEHKLWAD